MNASNKNASSLAELVKERDRVDAVIRSRRVTMARHLARSVIQGCICPSQCAPMRESIESLNRMLKTATWDNESVDAVLDEIEDIASKATMD